VTVLRRAGPADEGLLLELIREFYEQDGHDYDEAVLRPALAPLLAGDEFGVTWLIGDGQGYAVVIWGYSLESGGRDALLDEIYVREQGRGIGAAAMGEILDDLRRRDLSRMFLETERHNTRARRFYARLGFREEDSVWMTWEDGH
jgi:ribosomal protein S18 acetylase RimI-like enzyme